MNNVEVLDPEIKSEAKSQTELTHKLILWNDDKNSQEHVLLVLMNYFKMSFDRAVMKILEIEEHGKSPVFEGTVKEIEPYFIILVDNNLNATIE